MGNYIFSVDGMQDGGLNCGAIFFRYPYNNFLHHHVENVILSCLESKNSQVLDHLFSECNLIGSILEAEKNSILSDAGSDKVKLLNC